MANRSIHTPSALVSNLTLLVGQFKPNGAGAVAQSTIIGRGIASVARTAAGKFTVTLSDKWIELVSWSFGLSLQNPVGTVIIPMLNSTLGVIASKAIEIRLFNAVTSVNVDIGPNTNDIVYFQLWLRNQTNAGA